MARCLRCVTRTPVSPAESVFQLCTGCIDHCFKTFILPAAELGHKGLQSAYADLQSKFGYVNEEL